MNNEEIFTVVYEDNHLIAVSKQAGVLVQGDHTGDLPLAEYVKLYLKEKYQKPGNVFCGVIHRLDRPVSGLVLLAKTSKALERMNRQFQQKEVEKIYLAKVQGKPQNPAGTLVHWLIKNTETNTTRAYSSDKMGGLRSELDYKVLRSQSNHSLVEVYPKTGRPHQIRVQMASLGCPIVGDLRYGYPSPNPDQSICLHALKLRFTHPVQDTMVEIHTPPPDWAK